MEFTFGSFDLPLFSAVRGLRFKSKDSYRIRREMMASLFSVDAIFLDEIKRSIRHNWTHWRIEDYYYAVPIERINACALIRISWDDNWKRWNLVVDGKIIDCEVNIKLATYSFLIALWENWNIRLDSDE